MTNKLTATDVKGALESAKRHPHHGRVAGDNYAVLCTPENEKAFLDAGVDIAEWYEAEPGIQRIRIKRRATPTAPEASA